MARRSLHSRMVLLGASAVLVTISVLLAACTPPESDGGSSTTTSEPSTSTSSTTTTTTLPPLTDPTVLRLVSDSGDYLGRGATELFTRAGATFTVTGSGSHIKVVVNGGAAETWTIDLSSPIGRQLAPGAFEAATRYPFQSPTAPGLSITGEGRGCNTSTGRFDVRELTTDFNGKPTSLVVDFEHHCEGVAPALDGTIRWQATDPYPDVVDTDLDGQIDATDNCPTVANPNQIDADKDHVGDACDQSITAPNTWLYLQSDIGDSIGAAGTMTLYPSDATFATQQTYSKPENVEFDINGGALNSWRIVFHAVSGRPQVGTYTNATRFPSQSPTVPGFDVSGAGRGCNTSASTFTIYEAVYNANGTAARFSADFEQHCSGAVPALHGSIRFNATLP